MLSVFDRARASGSPSANLHTAVTAMTAATRLGDTEYAEAVFAWLSTAGHAPNEYAWTALLRARRADWRAALEGLAAMRAANVRVNRHAVTAVLAACCGGGPEGYAAAVPLLESCLIDALDDDVDSHVCAAFITLFGRLRDATGVRRVWALARRRGCLVDSHLYCAYLSALLRAGDARHAAKLFMSTSPPASAHCYATGMRALGAAGMPDTAVNAEAAFQSMLAAGVVPNAHCHAALLGCYARVGDADGALRALDGALRDLENEAPPAVCTHLAMAACARCGRYLDTKRLLARLQASGCADVCSYSTVLMAAAVAALPEEAERVYAAMITAGIAPNDYTFTALIAAHGAAARDAATSTEAAACARRARGVRDRMRAHGVRPSVHVYNALIAACEAARDDNAAVALYEAMLADGVGPNTSTRRLMAIVGKRGVDSVSAAQSGLTAISARGAALMATLISRGFL